jgi:hypothetical protein
MPGDERDDLVDYYLDHHGIFTPEQKKDINHHLFKNETGSAYEAICINLGSKNSLTTRVIDMIDSAKYQDYGISWDRLLDFNIASMKKSKKTKIRIWCCI